MAEAAQPQFVNFHYGNALGYLAKRYPTAAMMVIEAAQNAIDAGATTVLVCIDFRRADARRIVVADNGRGMTPEAFGRALSSVAEGQKEEGSLGEFGVGFWAPLDKSTSFNVVSQVEGGNPYQWSFDCAKILASKLPCEVTPVVLNRMPPLAMPLGIAASLMGTPQWRTLLRIHGIVKDTVLGAVNLDKLQDRISQSLGEGMRRQGTTVYVVSQRRDGVDYRVIEPVRYLGEALPVVEYDDPLCGKVRFELYRALQVGSKPDGKLGVKELGGNYPIPWKDYASQSISDRPPTAADAFEALGSGVFEGLIEIAGVALEIERDKFSLGDPLKASYSVIERWFRDHGRALYDTQKEVVKKARFQTLGERSLAEILEAVQYSTAFRPLLESLTDLLPGVREARPKSTRAVAPAKPRTSNTKPNSSRSGNRRKVLVPDPEASIGNVVLQYDYQILSSGRAWEFDRPAGRITFNVLHPMWTLLAETKGKHTARHDKQLVDFQKWLTFEILMLLMTYPEPVDFERFRHLIDDRVTPYATMFIIG